MKYIIKYRNLQIGDIIIDREDSDESRNIRSKTHSDYSHARIYVGGTLMEANGIGVQSVNPQRVLYDSPEDFIVLRHTTATKLQLIQACRYARSEFAKEYGVQKLKNTQYCFRLVAEAYEYAGVGIVANPKRCTANDFLKADSLVIITNMCREANERDLEIAESEGVMRDKGHYNQQSETAADMFAQIRHYVREKGEDADIIQDDDKLFGFLIQHPEFDDGIADILRKSPYFTLWQLYERQNPWEFDAELLVEKYGEHSKEISRQLLESCDDENTQVWFEMFLIVTSIYNKYKYKSIEVYVELYTNLMLMNTRRRLTAESVLFAN